AEAFHEDNFDTTRTTAAEWTTSGWTNSNTGIIKWKENDTTFEKTDDGHVNVTVAAAGGNVNETLTSKTFDLSKTFEGSAECMVFNMGDAADKLKFAIEYKKTTAGGWLEDTSETISGSADKWKKIELPFSLALGKANVRIKFTFTTSSKPMQIGIDNFKLTRGSQFIYKQGNAGVTYYRREIKFSKNSKNKKIKISSQGTAVYSVFVNGNQVLNAGDIDTDEIKTFSNPYDFDFSDDDTNCVVTFKLGDSKFNTYANSALSYKIAVDEKMKGIVDTTPPRPTNLVAYAKSGKNIDKKANPSPFQYSKDFIVTTDSSDISGIKRCYYKVWSYPSPSAGPDNKHAPADDTDGHFIDFPITEKTDNTINIDVTVDYERETCSVWFVDANDINGFDYRGDVLLRVDRQKPPKVTLLNFKSADGVKEHPQTAIIGQKKPRFRWNKAVDPKFNNTHLSPAKDMEESGVGYYQIQLSSSGDFSDPDFDVFLKNDETIFTNEVYLDPRDTIPMGNYVWRVRSIDSLTDTTEMNFSDWSNTGGSVTGELHLDYHPPNS
ncbi:MAG TPA: hypothetical protein PK467_17655, partial [Candidatus Wallbacteria bacterium]|nr:hypothetical protein [Candidatus Wallbacteria bacterium]